MEVCVIAKCTYKSETMLFSVSSESSMVDILKTLCLRTDFFRKAYESPIFPIPDIGKGLGSNSFAAGVVLPPITKRPAGRPPTKRIKAFGEFKRPLKCSRCSVTGHNRKICKAVI
ncbi:unnamed protein product [Prunus armeniaca]